MKNLILLSGIILLVLTSCEHEDVQPRANFIADENLVLPGEVISFQNSSYDATYFEWDFGDGTYSSQINPSHYYTQEGIYRVTLTAYNGSRIDYAYVDIEVQETTLEVYVEEYYDKLPIAKAKVTLYTSFSDWESFSSPVITGITNSDGVVVFKGLETRSYYIDVWHEYYDNEELAYEDVGFIKTLPLYYAEYNVFTAKVDYVPPTNKMKSSSTNESRVRTKVTKDNPRIAKESEKPLQRVK